MGGRMECFYVLRMRLMVFVGKGTFDAEQLLLCGLAARVEADGIYLSVWVLGAVSQLHKY